MFVRKSNCHLEIFDLEKSSLTKTKITKRPTFPSEPKKQIDQPQ